MLMAPDLKILEKGRDKKTT